MQVLKLPLAIVTAVFLLAGPPAVAQDPLHIHFISGSNEYESEASLKEYKQYLEDRYHVDITASWVQDRASNLPGIEHIPAADLLLIFTRRMELPSDQMRVIAKHWQQGKPIVGIRTASHAFRDSTNAVFDHEVMGGNYTGHFGDESVDVRSLVDHPVLEDVEDFSSGKMYKAGPLAEDAQILQIGTIASGETHAVTWVHTYNGGRMFYTSLGIPDDFDDEQFIRMLTNALFWTSRRTGGEMRR